MPVLTFTEVIPSKQTPAGKWTPTKAKAGATTYILAKSVIPQIENALGTALDCTITSKSREYNGKTYTDYTVESAKHVVAATAPESASKQTSTPTPTEAVGFHVVGPTVSTPPDRERLIVRQSALKAALEYHFAVRGSVEQDLGEITATADYFTDWVFSETAPKNNGSRTVAQQHLEDIREKVTDIRSTYSDEDAVCPACGRREWLKQWSEGWFCSKKDGGCGAPRKGERLDTPPSYGEWKAQTSANSVPWK